MQSCLYEGTVWHRRLTPVEHGFRYHLSLLYLDLAEIETVFAGRWLWSTQRPAVARFRREDHLGPKEQPLADAVRKVIADHNFEPPSGPIRLLTQPRFLGYVMNPVSFFYCFDAAEELRYIVAEVNNTPWGERHCYVIPFDQMPPQAKEFHVSPFMPMDMVYHWQCSRPGPELNIAILNFRAEELVFTANMTLQRREITTASLFRSLIRYPLLPQQVIFGIYWQAFLLWSKGCRYFPHPNAPSAKRLPNETANK